MTTSQVISPSSNSTQKKKKTFKTRTPFSKNPHGGPLDPYAVLSVRSLLQGLDQWIHGTCWVSRFCTSQVMAIGERDCKNSKKRIHNIDIVWNYWISLHFFNFWTFPIKSCQIKYPNTLPNHKSYHPKIKYPNTLPNFKSQDNKLRNHPISCHRVINWSTPGPSEDPSCSSKSWTGPHFRMALVTGVSSWKKSKILLLRNLWKKRWGGAQVCSWTRIFYRFNCWSWIVCNLFELKIWFSSHSFGRGAFIWNCHLFSSWSLPS